MRSAAISSGEWTLTRSPFVPIHAAAPQLLRDTNTANADPHAPGFTVRVAQFFEE
jgi:hypothetical protein